MEKNLVRVFAMKVGILTLSASDNCGSLLQAYALQKVIAKMGHDVEIIDFATDVSEKMYRIFHPSYLLNAPKKFFGTFFRYGKVVKQKKDYQLFRENFLKMSTNKYYRENDLKKADGLYDVVICGSDQVWNAYMRDFDKAYLLSWCKNSKRVSYAASFGNQKGRNLGKIFELGLNFDDFWAVSVREKSIAERLKNELNKDVSLCLDPTLLIEKSEWLELVDEKQVPKEDYIFYYSYNYEDDIKNKMVSDFAKAKGLPVYVINASRWLDGKEKKFGFIIAEQSGPMAFLNLMSGCKYSLVESFHGTVFSYILQKNFLFLKNNNENVLDDRINDLLELIGMKERVLLLDMRDYESFECINYGIQNDAFLKLKEASKEFIKDIC